MALTSTAAALTAPGLARIQPSGIRAPARELERRGHPVALEPLAIGLGQRGIELDERLPGLHGIAIGHQNGFHAPDVAGLDHLHLARTE